VSFFGLMILD